MNDCLNVACVIRDLQCGTGNTHELSHGHVCAVCSQQYKHMRLICTTTWWRNAVMPGLTYVNYVARRLSWSANCAYIVGVWNSICLFGIRSGKLKQKPCLKRLMNKPSIVKNIFFVTLVIGHLHWPLFGDCICALILERSRIVVRSDSLVLLEHTWRPIWRLLVLQTRPRNRPKFLSSFAWEKCTLSSFLNYIAALFCC